MTQVNSWNIVSIHYFTITRSPRIPTGALYPYSVLSVLFFFFPCWCDHTSLAGTVPQYLRLLFYATPSFISFIGVSLAFYFLLKYLSVLFRIISHVPPFSHNPYRLTVGKNYVYVGVSPFLSVLLLEATRFIRIPPFVYFRDCRSAVTLSEYKSRSPVELPCL